MAKTKQPPQPPASDIERNDRLELWAKALESGEFKQTNGTLWRTKTTDEGPAGMCCLGVMCEVYQRQTGDGKWKFSPDRTRKEFHLSGAYGLSFPPLAVAGWFGLNDGDPTLRPRAKENRQAAALNDELHWDFNKIAQQVRKLKRKVKGK